MQSLGRPGQQGRAGRDQVELGLKEMFWLWYWSRGGLHTEPKDVWQTQVPTCRVHYDKGLKVRWVLALLTEVLGSFSIGAQAVAEKAQETFIHAFIHGIFIEYRTWHWEYGYEQDRALPFMKLVREAGVKYEWQKGDLIIVVINAMTRMNTILQEGSCSLARQSVNALSKRAGIQDQSPSAMASLPAVHLDQVKQVLFGGSNLALLLRNNLSNCRDRPCAHAKKKCGMWSETKFRTRRADV